MDASLPERLPSGHERDAAAARMDLAEAISDDDVLHLRCATTFGDISVQVPDGVEVELTGLSVFGDRRLELAPLPRITGSPLIQLHASTVFGDVRVRSAGVPQVASLWRRALDRLSPPPPTALPHRPRQGPSDASSVEQR
ncbi:MAG: hypothetical protein WKF51_09430 [Geodermatophilaceae bacterium]